MTAKLKRRGFSGGPIFDRARRTEPFTREEIARLTPTLPPLLSKPCRQALDAQEVTKRILRLESEMVVRPKFGDLEEFTTTVLCSIESLAEAIAEIAAKQDVSAAGPTTERQCECQSSELKAKGKA